MVVLTLKCLFNVYHSVVDVGGGGDVAVLVLPESVTAQWTVLVICCV